MTARLLLDEMYPPALAEQLQHKGHDVIAVAADPELVGSDDATVLDTATAGGRCLVTENVRDFVVLARQTRHAGVLLVNSGRWTRTRVGISRLVAALDQAIISSRLPQENEVGWLS